MHQAAVLEITVADSIRHIEPCGSSHRADLWPVGGWRWSALLMLTTIVPPTLPGSHQCFGTVMLNSLDDAIGSPRGLHMYFIAVAELAEPTCHSPHAPFPEGFSSFRTSLTSHPPLW